MKAATIILGLLACSMAVPVKRQAYRPVMYVPHGQRLMYVQYVQPSHPNARSNGVAAFVAGDSVATGSYIKEKAPVEAPVEETPVEDEVAPVLKGSSAQAVAEAYPAPLEDDEEEATDDNTSDKVSDEPQNEKKPKQLVNPEYVPVDDQDTKTGPVVDEELPQSDAPQENEEAPASVPVKRFGPKKVYVDLEAPVDDELEYSPPARVPVYAAPQVRPTNRPATQKPKPQSQLPSGSFFPINFGGASGGAIAIANSFSTGEGGSASSHAIAYGSPDAARARKAAVRRH